MACSWSVKPTKKTNFLLCQRDNVNRTRMQPKVKLTAKLKSVAIKEKVNVCVCVCAENELVAAQHE